MRVPVVPPSQRLDLKFQTLRLGRSLGTLPHVLDTDRQPGRQQSQGRG